jgi:hypothetical protein
VDEIVARCLTCGEPYRCWVSDGVAGSGIDCCSVCHRCSGCCKCPRSGQEVPSSSLAESRDPSTESRLTTGINLVARALMEPGPGDWRYGVGIVETTRHRFHFPTGTERIIRGDEEWYVLPDSSAIFAIESKGEDLFHRISVPNLCTLRLEIHELPGGGTVWIPLDAPASTAASP